MEKLQFEVRFLVEADASDTILRPRNLEELIKRNDFIVAKAKELQKASPAFQSVRCVVQLHHGLKDYTKYVSDLTTEAYCDILRLMKEHGYPEFDFREHGVSDLATITYTDDDCPKQLACEKIIVKDESLFFQGNDGNNYSFSELADTDIFYIFNTFSEGLSDSVPEVKSCKD